MNRQTELDQLKLLFAQKILETVDLQIIRTSSLNSLERWNSNGVWCTAHNEWRELMTNGSDEEVIAAMSGKDERANRLRQSPPYVGLLDEDARESLIEKARLR